MAALARPSESLKERIARLSRVNRVLERQPTDHADRLSMVARRKMAFQVEAALHNLNNPSHEQPLQRALSMNALPRSSDYCKPPPFSQSAASPKQPARSIEVQTFPSPPPVSANSETNKADTVAFVEPASAPHRRAAPALANEPLRRVAPILSIGVASSNDDASLNWHHHPRYSAVDLRHQHQAAGRSAAASELRKHVRMTELHRQHTPLKLPKGCSLSVSIEYCTAERPGRNGSLRGCSEAYVHHRDCLRQLLHVLFPESKSTIVFANNVPLRAQPVHVSSSPICPPVPGWRHATPLQTESASRIPLANGWRTLAARVGAFEVDILLQWHNVTHEDCADGNTEGTHTTYGPVNIFSKLEAGRFPIHDQLADTIKLHVGELISVRLREVELERSLATSPATRISIAAESEGGQNHTELVALPLRTEDKWEKMHMAAADAISVLPPLQVPCSHTLSIRIECCTAPRPGRNGSLRGSTETYARYLQLWTQHASAMLPAAQLVVNVQEGRGLNEEAPGSIDKIEQGRTAVRATPPRASLTWQRVAQSQSAGSLHTSSANGIVPRAARPAPSLSRKPPQEGQKRAGWEGFLARSELLEWLPPKAKRYRYRAPPDVSMRQYTPRIGAFEIVVQLIGPSLHASSSPILVYSKLASGGFPEVHVFAELHRQARELIGDAQRPGGSAFHALHGASAARAIERSLSMQLLPEARPLPPAGRIPHTAASHSAAGLGPRLANLSVSHYLPGPGLEMGVGPR